MDIFTPTRGRVVCSSPGPPRETPPSHRSEPSLRRRLLQGLSPLTDLLVGGFPSVLGLEHLDQLPEDIVRLLVTSVRVRRVLLVARLPSSSSSSDDETSSSEAAAPRSAKDIFGFSVSTTAVGAKPPNGAGAGAGAAASAKATPSNAFSSFAADSARSPSRRPPSSRLSFPRRRRWVR